MLIKEDGVIGRILGVELLMVEAVNFSSSDSAATTLLVTRFFLFLGLFRQKTIILAPKSAAVIKTPKRTPKMSPYMAVAEVLKFRPKSFELFEFK